MDCTHFFFAQGKIHRLLERIVPMLVTAKVLTVFQNTLNYVIKYVYVSGVKTYYLSVETQ